MARQPHEATTFPNDSRCFLPSTIADFPRFLPNVFLFSDSFVESIEGFLDRLCKVTVKFL